MAKHNWLELDMKALVKKTARKDQTDRNGAIRDCITELLHIAYNEDIAIDKLLVGAEEVFEEELIEEM